MPRDEPNTDEIKSLIAAFGETYRFLHDLRKRRPMAEYIQYPKIPPFLSENLAVHAIRNGKLLPSIRPSLKSVSRGNNATADVVAIRNERPWPSPVPPSLAQVPELYIEIKGTGVSDFAGFGDKDYKAHILLWLRCGNLLFEGGLGVLDVLICPNPADHLPPGWAPPRVTVGQFTSAWIGEIERQHLDLRELWGG
jgi:hypothetical protein